MSDSRGDPCAYRRHRPTDWRIRDRYPLNHLATHFVCGVCHPCPWPLSCWIDTREVGFDARVMNDPGVRRVVVELRGDGVPSEPRRTVHRSDRRRTVTEVVNIHAGAEYDVLIARPSEWGNPYSHQAGTSARYQVPTRTEAVSAYRAWLWERIRSGEVTKDKLLALRGKRLGCYCKPEACHGDVIVAAIEWAAK